jgi:hypothetical protein
MKTEVKPGALFRPAFEMGLIQRIFPNLQENEQRLILKLRAATLLLTRGVNANLKKMDADILVAHEQFIRKLEIRWVALQKQIEHSGLLQKLTRIQSVVFQSEFAKVRFKRD